jgi:hypothetical protein
MDIIQWRDKMQRMALASRNIVLTDGIAWLESEERPKCKPEHVEHLVNFENALQQHLNVQRIPDGWYITAAQTYGSFPFFDRYLKRLK